LAVARVPVAAEEAVTVLVPVVAVITSLFGKVIGILERKRGMALLSIEGIMGIVPRIRGSQARGVGLANPIQLLAYPGTELGLVF
jgi:hypothetical protein